MKCNFYIVVVLSLVSIKQCRTEYLECAEKNSCRECIQTKGCAWCSKVKDKIFTNASMFSACSSIEKIKEICQEKYIENPKTTVKIISNQPMRNKAKGDTIQIRPQEISVQLKPGEEYVIDVQFKKAENYPIDLYYLMDFSSSMSKYKNNLSKLGNKLAETMKNLTTDFQLGFGSFVDKVTLPFTSTVPAHLQHPCPKCSPPYSFKNHMSLTEETERFGVEVGKANLSGNIDTPEGVLDALMQTMACQKQLNWREKARHIIVLSTDAPFHIAGDGKLGGIIVPHDGFCYLNEEGVYTHSLLFDYPSVSQINHKAVDNNMNIIFAVLKKVKNEYLSLSKRIRGSSLGLLDAGENIADLIKAQYEKIATTIRLTDNAKAPAHISYSALCSPDGEWITSNECSNIKEGSVAYFKLRILVSDCSSRMLTNQKITIKPVGMNETLTINLETLCDCDCTAANHPANEIKSKHCSYYGDLICGLCVCYKEKIGRNCECSGTNEEILKVKDTAGCISNNLTNEICSGHGECRCGVCQCYPNEKRTGKFCDCDNDSCERSNGLLCSGHGVCKCGKCLCDPNWSGSVCDCPNDISLCKANNEGEACSGKGKCNCGICQCQHKTKVDEHRYAGKYCQICMTCLQQNCNLFDDCVECASYGTGPHAINKCKNCTKLFRLHKVEKLEEIEKNDFGVSCVSADHSGCTFKYYYFYLDDGQLVVYSESQPLCLKEINLYAIIGGTIGSTVLIGLLSLIVWKVIVEIHDKREYEKFERERHLASWGRGENPLFKTATTSYENPTYTTDSC